MGIASNTEQLGAPQPIWSPPSPAEPSPPLGTRFHALDGLRGVAALAVLICHSMLMSIDFYNAYLVPGDIPKGTIAWWMSFTPLHILWAGGEAVFVFFVLSGFVMILPFLKPGPQMGRWIGYYPKRLVRLYVPVWGAFALFLLWVTIVPREVTPLYAPYLQLQVPDINPDTIRMDLLLFPSPSSNNNVLWSLRMEVVFSLLLPVYLYLGRKLAVLNWLKFALLLGLSMHWAMTGYTLRAYLPMFGLGTIMALERHRLAALAHRISSMPAPLGGAVWALLSAVAIGLLTSYWMLLGITLDPETLLFWAPIVRGLTLLGACLLLFLAMGGPFRRALETPPAQWMGKRSFSLYVVHQPIVVSTGLVLGGNPGAGLTLLVAVPASLLIAEVFYRLVEYPSLQASRWIGRSVEKALDRPLEPSARYYRG